MWKGVPGMNFRQCVIFILGEQDSRSRLTADALFSCKRDAAIQRETRSMSVAMQPAERVTELRALLSCQCAHRLFPVYRGEKSYRAN
jgi:hypothetical protein